MTRFRSFSRQVMEGLRAIGETSPLLSHGMVSKWFYLRCTKRVSKLVSVRIDSAIENMTHIEWMGVVPDEQVDKLENGNGSVSMPEEWMLAEDIPASELRNLVFEYELEDGFQIVMRVQNFGMMPVMIRGTCIWLREDVVKYQPTFNMDDFPKPSEGVVTKPEVGQDFNDTRRLEVKDLNLPDSEK